MRILRFAPPLPWRAAILLFSLATATQLSAQTVQPVGGDPATWGPPLPGQQIVIPSRPTFIQDQPTVVYETQQVWVPGQWDSQGNWTPGHYKMVQVERQIDHGHHHHDSGQAGGETAAGMGRAGRYRYTKPFWLTDWERNERMPVDQRPGYHQRTVMQEKPDPNQSNLNWVAQQIASRDSRNLRLKQVHYLSWQNPAPNEYRLKIEHAVMEFEDRNRGESIFMDVTIRPGIRGRSFQATQLYSEVARGRRHDHDQPANYRRPNWVNAAAVPGGIVPRDIHQREVQIAATAAVALINAAGQPKQLAEVLHAGGQALAQPKTYLVLEFTDGQIWEVVLTTADNNASAQWSSLQ